MIKTVKMVKNIKNIKIFKNGKNDQNGIFGIPGVPKGYEPQTMIANESRNIFEKNVFRSKKLRFQPFW